MHKIEALRAALPEAPLATAKGQLGTRNQAYAALEMRDARNRIGMVSLKSHQSRGNDWAWTPTGHSPRPMAPY